MTDEFKIGSSPPKITEKVRLELDCPNKKCNYAFDVTNLDWGLMMECPLCKNKTYNPTYDKNKYTLKQIFLTFATGIVVSLLAQYIFNYITK